MAVDPVVVAACVSAGPATVAAWAALRIKRETRTNHGKTIGQHVEEASLHAQEAAVKAAQVAVDLATYKLEAFIAQGVAHNEMLGYVAEDAKAHAGLRELILTQAASTRMHSTDLALKIMPAEPPARAPAPEV